MTTTECRFCGVPVYIMTGQSEILHDPPHCPTFTLCTNAEFLQLNTSELLTTKLARLGIKEPDEIDGKHI